MVSPKLISHKYSEKLFLVCIQDNWTRLKQTIFHIILQDGADPTHLDTFPVEVSVPVKITKYQLVCYFWYNIQLK